MLIDNICFYHFVPFLFTLTMAGGQQGQQQSKVSWLLFFLLHFSADQMKFTVVLK